MSFKISLKMIQQYSFDWDLYKKGGYKVVTRTGKEVTDITCNMKWAYPIEGLVEGMDDYESWFENGFQCKEQSDPLDLFMEKINTEAGSQ